MVSVESRIADPGQESAREKILAAAGEVFGEEGFEGATIRAITERAKVNVAAVNYYFRDKAELYSRVVVAACSIPAAWKTVALETPNSPEERFRRLIYEFLKRLLDPSRPAWKRRLLLRELADPTKALDELVERNIKPLRNEFMIPTLRELTGDGFPDPELFRISASVFGQCLYYVTGRPILERLNPAFEADEATISEIAHHISEFSLLAIAGLARRRSRA